MGRLGAAGQISTSAPQLRAIAAGAPGQERIQVDYLATAVECVVPVQQDVGSQNS